ncbi:MAG: LamG domain-containing protein [Candidatus Thorarchaeota archaeon]
MTWPRVRSISISLLISFTCPLFTLILLETPLKYIIYLFEVALILLLLSWMTNSKESVSTLKVDLLNALDILILYASLVLFSFNYLEFYNGITLILSLVATYFLPGYAILRLARFESMFTSLEWMGLSIAISSGISAIILNLFIFLESDISLFLSFIYVGFSLLPIIKRSIVRMRNPIDENGYYSQIPFSLSRSALLLWVLVFFGFVLTALYPQMVSFPGLDITRHASSAGLLLLAPEMYQSNYPWFHLAIAMVLELSHPALLASQTILACVSVFIFFAFYMVAKAYLSHFDKRAPELALIFFSVFGGFGWLLFFMIPMQARNELLRLWSEFSYWDTSYSIGPWTWFWFRPMTLAFSILFVMIYLLRRTDLSRTRYLSIYAFLTITLALVHVSEFIILTVMLLILALFGRNSSQLRVGDAALGSLLGSFLLVLYSGVSATLGVVIHDFPFVVYLFAIAASLLSYFAYTFERRRFDLSIHAPMLVRIASMSLIMLFSGGLITWLSNFNSFSVSLVYEIAYVPLMLYPVLLGFIGFLAFNRLTNSGRGAWNETVLIFGLLLLGILLFGLALTVVNLYVSNLGYGPRRFIPILFSSACIIASISFVESIRRISARRNAILAAVISLMVVSGMMSTALSIEYWDLRMPPAMSESTIESIEFLSDPGNRPPYAPVLTASSDALSRAQFVPSPYIIDRYRYPIWDSIQPEIPLLILESPPYSPPFLYMIEGDQVFLENNYPHRYFTSSLVHYLDISFQNSESTIYKVKDGVPPTNLGSIVLVKKGDNSKSFLSVMQMLSYGGYDYTICLSSDITTILSREIVIIPYDDADCLNLIETLKSSSANGGVQSIIIVNSLGYGAVSELFFNSVEDSGFEATHVTGIGSSFDFNRTIYVDSLEMLPESNLLAWYTNGIDLAPLACEIQYESAILTYVNAFPLLSADLIDYSAIDDGLIVTCSPYLTRDNMTRDISGNGNSGHLMNTNVQLESLGNALRFSHDNNSVRIYNSADLNPTNGITIDAWIKPNTPGSGFMIADKKASYNATTGFEYLFSGSLFYFAFGNGTHSFSEAVPYIPNSTAWQHFAVTYNRHVIRFFVNGEMIGSASRSEYIGPSSADLLLGQGHLNEWNLDGALLRLSLYNRSLSESEIQQNYNSTVSKMWSRYAMTDILGGVFDVIGLAISNEPHYENWIHEGHTAFFGSSHMAGLVSISNPVIPEFQSTTNANIEVFSDGSRSYFSNISNWTLNGISPDLILASGLITHSGMGFYALWTLINPEIHLRNEITASLVISNGTSYNIILQGGTVRIFGNASIVVRTPIEVSVEGTAAFNDMYTLFSLFSEMQSTNHQIEIEGTAELVISASDSYTFATNFSWSGFVNRNPPFLRWDEFASIAKMVPWVLLVSVLILLYSIRKKRRLMEKFRREPWKLILDDGSFDV